METGNMSKARNQEAINRLYLECLNNREWKLLENIIDENYEGPFPGTGPAAFENAVKNIFDAFPDLRFTIHDLFSDKNKVAVRWEWMGTNENSFRGFPASGKKVVVNGIAIFEFFRGKVIRSWLQNDRLELLLQIGAVQL